MNQLTDEQSGITELLLHILHLRLGVILGLLQQGRLVHQILDLGFHL